MMLHLGDYIYEVSNHPPASQTVGPDIGRPYDPDHECVTLEDYRRRYAHYRLDPDVQRLHHVHPVVGIVDDHEFADGVWRGGSIEHRVKRDGPWRDRRAAAFRARWEWMPQRMPDPSDPERVWRRVPIGDLADRLLIDTRTKRDEPVNPPAMQDPSRSQLQAEQRGWLLGEIRRSRAAWRLIGNSSVMGNVWVEGIPEAARPGLMKLEMTNEAGTGPDPDQWDGYPAERAAILEAFEEAGDVVVLSGDVHVTIAMALHREPTDGRPIAAEFVTASLTSQNVDDKMGWEPRTGSVPMEEAWMSAARHVRWTDWDSQGYMVIDITPETITGEWWFVDEVRERTDREHLGARFAVHRGRPPVIDRLA